MIVETILVCAVISAVTSLLTLAGISVVLWVKWTTWQDVKLLVHVASIHGRLNETQQVKTVENLTQVSSVLAEMKEEGTRTREVAKEAAKTVVQKAEEIKQVVAQSTPLSTDSGALPVVRDNKESS